MWSCSSWDKSVGANIVCIFLNPLLHSTFSSWSSCLCEGSVQPRAVLAYASLGKGGSFMSLILAFPCLCLQSLMLAEASWYKERLTGGGTALILLSVPVWKKAKKHPSLRVLSCAAISVPMVAVVLKVPSLGRSICKAFSKQWRFHYENWEIIRVWWHQEGIFHLHVVWLPPVISSCIHLIKFSSPEVLCHIMAHHPLRFYIA